MKSESERDLTTHLKTSNQQVECISRATEH